MVSWRIPSSRATSSTREHLNFVLHDPKYNQWYNRQNGTVPHQVPMPSRARAEPEPEVQPSKLARCDRPSPWRRRRRRARVSPRACPAPRTLSSFSATREPPAKKAKEEKATKAKKRRVRRRPQS